MSTVVQIDVNEYTVRLTESVYIVRLGHGGTGDVKGPFPPVVDEDIVIWDGSTGKCIKSSGVGFPIPLANLDVPLMIGASALTAGDSGLVPAPAIGEQNLVLTGDGTWSSAGAGDVVGPGSSTDEAIAIWDGTTGQLLADSAVGFPIPVSEGGTGATNATDARANLSAASTTHAASHLSSGSDPIALMGGATGVAPGTDGLVPPPAAGQQGHILLGDGTWSPLPSSNVDTDNVIWVSPAGNDGTGTTGRLDLPFLTIGAALAVAVSGDLVYVLPGTYDETGLVLPTGVTLAGIDRLRCVISSTVLTASTVVTMGDSSSLENLTIEAGTSSGRTLVSFPGTTSSTSVGRNLLLTGLSGSVNAVSVLGSGVSAQNWVTLDMVDCRGVGLANGLISSTTGFFIARDCLCSGLVGISVTAGQAELQDCKCQGVIGLSISVGATCYVNLSTRWLGTTPLNNLGTLLIAGENFYTEVGGDLAGTMPDPTVAAITETSGPTQLVIGAVADGEVLVRSGATLVSQATTTPSAHAASHENGGSDQISVAGLSGLLADAQTPTSHATSHQNGGGDEIDVTGLSGLLGDPQTPTAHASSHENGGLDEIDVTGLSGLLADAQTPTSHAASHESGGGDEISVLGLSGLLADAQTPLSHAASHENGGGDEIDVTGLSGLLGDAQTPLGHGSSHLSTGVDPISEFVGCTAVSDGLDGLVLKPTAGQESLFLRGDATWATPAGGAPGAPLNSVQFNSAGSFGGSADLTWSGTELAITGTVDISGQRHYGVLAADPTLPAPAGGDIYYNTVLEMLMEYDATRSAWLSVETSELQFNRNGNTGSGAYYRAGNRAMSATLGRNAEWDGTIVSLTYTRQDVDAAAFQVVASGSTIVTLASTSTSGETTNANGTFSAGDILAVRNAGPNASRHVIGTVRIKWRAP